MVRSMITQRTNDRVVNPIWKINPAFYRVWASIEPHKILYGGRSSTKSSVVSLRLLTTFLSEPEANILCFRKVANTLAGSVYEQIKWAIYELGVADRFFFGTSPRVIRDLRTGTAFYFFGVDDPLKIKSAKIAKGYVRALWFEELAEYKDFAEIDTVEDSFIRQKLPDNRLVEVWYTYNPPRSQYAWVNEWTESKKNDPQYFTHSSTYLDDERGFISGQLLTKIETYKKNDLDYYRWQYLGAIIGLGDTVYNMAFLKTHTMPELPANDPIILIDIAADTGHQVSATTYGAFALTASQKVILLDCYYYSPAGKAVKMAPSELSAAYWTFRTDIVKTYGRQIDRETIDSAEGALRNQIFKDHGLRLRAVNKLKKIDMIDHVQDLFAQGRFYILDKPSNAIFIDEHKRYAWDPDTIERDDPKVVKENDHTCDMMQYYVLDNRRKLGLKA